MPLWQRRIVRPTLLFSDVGVMVEAYEDHAFAESSPPLVVGHYHEIETPRGAALHAIQFIHTIGQRFEALQVFRLHYYTAQQPASLLEAYLSAAPHDSIKMRAVIVGADTLNRDTRRVICTLLPKSDPDAWEASPDFRRMLEAAAR